MTEAWDAKVSELSRAKRRRLRSELRSSASLGGLCPGLKRGLLALADRIHLWTRLPHLRRRFHDDTEALAMFFSGRGVVDEDEGLLEPIFASDGVFPVLPKGLYLRRRGHEVQMLAVPVDDREFVQAQKPSWELLAAGVAAP